MCVRSLTVAALKETVAALKEAVAALKEAVAALKETVAALKETVAGRLRCQHRERRHWLEGDVSLDERAFLLAAVGRDLR